MEVLKDVSISDAPWKVVVEDHRDYRLFRVEANDGSGIAEFDCCDEQFPCEVGFSNARLIAAAPTMYDQLLKDLDIFETILKTVEAKSFTEEAFILSVRYRVSAIKYTLANAGGESEVAK